MLGLVIFGGFTIFDFNRLRRTNQPGAVPIAASIFLDVFNVFLFFLQLFGGERNLTGGASTQMKAASSAELQVTRSGAG